MQRTVDTTYINYAECWDNVQMFQANYILLMQS